MVEKDSARSQRRFNAKNKQRKRIKEWEQSRPSWDKNPQHYCKLKDGHFGCSCYMCQPHKWGLEEELKVSERRKLQDDEEV